MQHYASIGGWSGVHCEGSLWRSLALLLLWELVYDSAVPHVFQQPCQTVPMDLYSPFFALNRQTALETFVAGIRSGALDGKQLLQLNYEANFNVSCCKCPIVFVSTFSGQGLVSGQLVVSARTLVRCRGRHEPRHAGRPAYVRGKRFPAVWQGDARPVTVARAGRSAAAAGGSEGAARPPVARTGGAFAAPESDWPDGHRHPRPGGGRQRRGRRGGRRGRTGRR